jgi:hypothetical protein
LTCLSVPLTPLRLMGLKRIPSLLSGWALCFFLAGTYGE